MVIVEPMSAGRTRSYTMRDVARLARVSVATVSAVANGKQIVTPPLVKRVQEAMRALDYHPDQVARSLKVGRNCPTILSPSVGCADSGGSTRLPVRPKHVAFNLQPRDLSLVNERGDRVVTGGRYQVRVGGGQPGTAPGVEATLLVRGEQTLPE